MEKGLIKTEVGAGTNQVAKTGPELKMQVYDLEKDLPDLSQFKPVNYDLVSDYWTPEQVGESKDLFFVGFEVKPAIDSEGTVIGDLEHAIFLEKKEDGNIRQVSNASKRLVGKLKDHRVERGNAFNITYKGKRKNKSNNFSSDNWSIKPYNI